MKYPKLRELKEAIKALIKGPYTNRFPYQEHKPFQRFRGKPYFHEESCMGCTACAQVCPAKVIDFEDKIENAKAKRVFTIHWDICIFCGQCEANCPTEKGIVLSREFDLATTGKREDLKQTIEKQLLLCDGCGGIVAPYDQILWVAKKLGPLIFSNASVMLTYLNNLGLCLKRKITPKKEEEFLRSERINILCPRCRRIAVLKS